MIRASQNYFSSAISSRAHSQCNMLVYGTLDHCLALPLTYASGAASCSNMLRVSDKKLVRRFSVYLLQENFECLKTIKIYL